MVIVIDADYNEKTRQGHAAGVLAESVFSHGEAGIVTATVDNIGSYIPGRFYLRELKCIDAVLAKVSLKDISLIVIDGYADLGTTDKALGTHVFEKYGIPVIGVAKNRYRTCFVENTEVVRGNSTKKLYVTCAGMDHEEAKRTVIRMAGENRLPWLIKLADTCARDWTAGSTGRTGIQEFPGEKTGGNGRNDGRGGKEHDGRTDVPI